MLNYFFLGAAFLAAFLAAGFLAAGFLAAGFFAAFLGFFAFLAAGFLIFFAFFGFFALGFLAFLALGSFAGSLNDPATFLAAIIFLRARRTRTAALAASTLLLATTYLRM